MSEPLKSYSRRGAWSIAAARKDASEKERPGLSRVPAQWCKCKSGQKMNFPPRYHKRSPPLPPREELAPCASPVTLPKFESVMFASGLLK